jgi:hypothetical protein
MSLATRTDTQRMGWANSIPRACTLIVLLVAVFALTACGNGDRDPRQAIRATGAS